MEQVFLNDKCKFYAREAKGEKPQIIYFNAKVGNQQFVISTNVKVKPEQFNVKRQIAIVSNEFCELDNRNNSVVNDTIKLYRNKWSEYIKWLSQNPDKLSEAKQNIVNFVPMKKKGNNGGNGKKFSETLEYIFGKQIEYELEKHIIEPPRANVKRSHLNIFYDFIKAEVLPDKWEVLNIKTYRQYSDWLVVKSLNVSTINAYLSSLKSIVNGVCKRDLDREPIDTRRWELVKKQITTSDSKSINYVFSDEQLQSIVNLDLSGTAAIIRDIFVFGCYVGQRPADNVRLLKGEGKRFNSNGIEVISLLPHKTRKTDKIAFVPIFNVKLVDAIIERFRTDPNYIEYLNKTDTQRNALNGNYIKKIFARAGLNDTYNATRQRGNDTVSETKNQAQAAHAYLSRHYFITYMCRNGVGENEVIEMTGHTSTKQIHDTYAHLTAEQQADKLTARASIQALAGNKQPQENGLNNAEIKTMIGELKKILTKEPDHDFVNDYAKEHGVTEMEAAKELGNYIGDIIEASKKIK